ncbi:MAG: hypothetical protein E7270_08155 [Lachnospiraceae bacterium]|nr:hypothetical protein [Lachnospiraceae bacterium]
MIIDMHVHCGIAEPFYMPNSMVEEMIEKYNIDHVILSDIRACENTQELTPVPEDIALPQNQVFRETIAFARKHPGKIYVMPWIKPTTDGVDDEFISIIENNKDVVKGLKLHAHNSMLRSDSPLLEPYYELAAKYSLPVLIHTGGIEEASAIYVYNAAKSHPDVNFIMGHLGLGTNNIEAIDLVSKLPNLYGDTAWVPIQSVLYFIEKCGDDRLLFGSDSPIDGLDTYVQNGKGEPSLYLQYFNDLKELISEESYDKIMYKNSARLFNI